MHEGELKVPVAGPALMRLGWVSQFAALCGMLAVLFSVCQQVAFFSYIDPKLLSFMTLQDIISNSLGFVPVAIAGVAFIYLFELVKERIVFPDLPENVYRFVFSTYNRKTSWGWYIVDAIFVLGFVLFTKYWFSAVVFFFGLRQSGLRRFLDRLGLGQLPGMSAVLLVIFYCFLAMSSGSREAIGIQERTDNYRLELASGEVEQVLFLRKSAGFTMFRNSSGAITVLPDDAIARMTEINVRSYEAYLSVDAVVSWVVDGFSQAVSFLGFTR